MKKLTHLLGLELPELKEEEMLMVSFYYSFLNFLLYFLNQQ